MIPQYVKPPIPIPVQALRDFVCKYGPDVAVLATWTHEEGGINYRFVTVGSNRQYADGAVRLRDLFAQVLELPNHPKFLEDLRADHPAISSTTLKALLDVLHYELPNRYENLTAFQKTLINQQQYAEIERERNQSKATVPEPAMYVRFVGKHDEVIKQLAAELEMDPQKVAEHALTVYQFIHIRRRRGMVDKWFNPDGTQEEGPPGCGGE